MISSDAAKDSLVFSVESRNDQPINTTINAVTRKYF